MIRKLSGPSEDTDNDNPTGKAPQPPSHGDRGSFTSAKYEVKRKSDSLDRRKSEKTLGLAQLPSNGPNGIAAPPSSTRGALQRSLFPTQEQTLDKMAEPRLWRKSRARSPWSCSLITLIATFFAGVTLLFIVHAFITRQLDPKGCDMCWSRPIYINFSDFDTEHTRFATKYGLYMLREGGFDEDPKVRIPNSAPAVQSLHYIRSRESPYCSYQGMQEVSGKLDVLLSSRLNITITAYNRILRY